MALYDHFFKFSMVENSTRELFALLLIEVEKLNCLALQITELYS